MATLIQLTNAGAGIKLPVEEQNIEFGRDEDCDVALDDELVSMRHAVLKVVLQQDKNRIDYILEDKNSTNHTFVNGDRIEIRDLKDGDVIRMGKNNFRFEDETKGDFAATVVLNKTWIPGVFYTSEKKEK